MHTNPRNVNSVANGPSTIHESRARFRNCHGRSSGPLSGGPPEQEATWHYIVLTTVHVAVEPQCVALHVGAHHRGPRDLWVIDDHDFVRRNWNTEAGNRIFIKRTRLIETRFVEKVGRPLPSSRRKIRICEGPARNQIQTAVINSPGKILNTELFEGPRKSQPPHELPIFLSVAKIFRTLSRTEISRIAGEIVFRVRRSRQPRLVVARRKPSSTNGGR